MCLKTDRCNDENLGKCQGTQVNVNGIITLHIGEGHSEEAGRGIAGIARATVSRKQEGITGNHHRVVHGWGSGGVVRDLTLNCENVLCLHQAD